MILILKIAITAVVAGLGIGATGIVLEWEFAEIAAIIIVLLGLLSMIAGGLIILWS